MRIEKHHPAFDYILTHDPFQAGYGEDFTPEVQDKLRDAVRHYEKGKPQLLPKLLKLIKKYPNIADFKDILSTYYFSKNQPEKAIANYHRIIEENPNYVYARLWIANYYLEEGQFEEVPKLLGENFNLQTLFPKRKAFLYQEFDEFMLVVGYYLIETEAFDEAEEHIKILEKRYPGSQHLDFLKEGLEIFISPEPLHQFFGHTPSDFNEPSIGRSYDKSIQTRTAPILHHPELKELYHYGMDIPKEALENILKLPAETLIPDLEAILWDSVCRFEYFTEREENGADEALNAPLHVLFLLTELKSSSSLPILLDCFRQGADYMDFWYGDHTFVTLWHFVYHLGQDQLDVLKAFMIEPDIHYYGKAIISSAMKQTAFHQKARLPEIKTWYHSILTYYLDHQAEDGLIDIELISFLIEDIADLPNSRSMLDVVGEFYDRDLVDEGLIGPFDELAYDMESDDWKKAEETLFTNIFDHYQYLINNEEDSFEDLPYFSDDMLDEFDDEPLSLPFFNAPKPDQPVTSNKVGRNEPCPCGSGKKYKKCCWGK